MSLVSNRRCCVIVLDACGVGELPDAAAYGDVGSHTLGHVAAAVDGLRLPTLESLGLGNVADLRGCAPAPHAPSVSARLLERSVGKDSTTGHWELMGVVTKRPFPVYPSGFPREVISEFEQQTARAVIGNVAASGTEIIQQLGDEHRRTGAWIVYTSADSVFMIAAHEDTVPLAELYRACRLARDRILVGRHRVGRVIARPFVGSSGNYVRTPMRRDFSVAPPTPTYLTLLRTAGVRVTAVGKIADLFAHRDIDDSHPTKSNLDGIETTCELLQAGVPGLIFTNLVETDMLWGHRNDPINFYRSLSDFDTRLPDLLSALTENDLLIVTSDHGCDPTLPSPYHTREYAFALLFTPAYDAGGCAVIGEFADVGATVFEWLAASTAHNLPGRSLLRTSSVTTARECNRDLRAG
jgi:phosphopentomutase